MGTHLSTLTSSTIKILALDVATKTGWAHSAGPCGTWQLKEYADEGGGMRFARLAGKLREIHQSLGFDVLVYEDVSVGARGSANNRAQKFLAQATGIVRLFCEERDIPYEAVNLASIKAHACPGRKVKKEDILAAARKKWGTALVTDDNIADALWLLDYEQNRLSCLK